MKRICNGTVLLLSYLMLFNLTPCKSQLLKSNNANEFGSIEKIPFSFTGNIYFLAKGTGRLPKNFNKYDSKGKIHTNQLNIQPRSFTKGFPGINRRIEWFAIDYHGFFYLAKAEHLVFSLLSDDGSKLIIDNKVIINHDGQHGVSIKYGTVKLEAGIHRINVPYFQGPRYDLALVLAYKRHREKKYQIFDINDFLPVKLEVIALDSIEHIADDEFEDINDSLICTLEINSSVLFDINQWEIKPEAEIVLDEIYHAYLEHNPIKHMVIEGHTDNIGSEEYNMDLSEKRAQNVAAYLDRTYSLNNRLKTIAYGEKKPNVANNSANNRTMNRRVELQIMDSILIRDYLLNIHDTL